MSNHYAQTISLFEAKQTNKPGFLFICIFSDIHFDLFHFKLKSLNTGDQQPAACEWGLLVASLLAMNREKTVQVRQNITSYQIEKFKGSSVYYTTYSRAMYPKQNFVKNY